MTERQQSAYKAVENVNKALKTRGFDSSEGSSNSSGNSSGNGSGRQKVGDVEITRGGGTAPVVVKAIKIELLPEFEELEGRLHTSFDVKDGAVDALVVALNHFEEIATSNGKDNRTIQKVQVGSLRDQLAVSLRKIKGQDELALCNRVYGDWVNLRGEGLIPTTLHICKTHKSVEFVMGGNTLWYTAYEAAMYLEYVVEAQNAEEGEEVLAPAVNIAEDFFKKFKFPKAEGIKNNIKARKDALNIAEKFMGDLEKVIQDAEKQKEEAELAEEIKLQEELRRKIKEVKEAIKEGVALRKIMDNKGEAKALLEAMRKEGGTKELGEYRCVFGYVVGMTSDEVLAMENISKAETKMLTGKKEELTGLITKLSSYMVF
jgi:hypothetical protein